jgi:hypothetical protein
MSASGFAAHNIPTLGSSVAEQKFGQQRCYKKRVVGAFLCIVNDNPPFSGDLVLETLVAGGRQLGSYVASER